MKIPLFDVDWTLLRGGNPAHVRSFAHAFWTVYGIEASIEHVDCEEMIDNQVLVEVLGRHGVTPLDTVAKIAEAQRAMVTYFREHEDEGAYEPLPGAVATLIQLRTQGVPVGVLTGNVAEIAWHKLERAGLRRFVTFGAFGSEAYRRSDLIAIARVRSGRPDHAFVLVGDSPRDIACAKEGRLESVAVASGKYSAQQLRDAGADVVIPSLRESVRAFRVLDVL